jgi:hypothetical protein
MLNALEERLVLAMARGRLMDEQQLLALKPELDRFLDRFAPHFGREETQAHAPGASVTGRAR